MATKNVESVFSGKVKHWKDLELYQKVSAIVHGFSYYIKSSVIDYCKDWFMLKRFMQSIWFLWELNQFGPCVEWKIDKSGDWSNLLINRKVQSTFNFSVVHRVVS